MHLFFHLIKKYTSGIDAVSINRLKEVYFESPHHDEISLYHLHFVQLSFCKRLDNDHA
jgi:translation initiation factor 2 beta subunit (eIF-2beta)/eIF-5